ncbi:doubled CXXCH motif-containing protein [Desulfitobacterium dichloroeliminans LMG P-21439]|uniref:Doubled CXXCH motif-containing protein n=1 Tax=Desulfitobacterium dichloroeliminans (strain LMG P-21439 / DCA1) TaxID=871963 RepID=L0F5P0_DESDL|nr:cytochrome c3 family protein [Desulfitobacterium dichloroeliminans]AGA69134.1 doubled CXXCH motif-containing protein [Desulfitobacterium dichloroeliminans LMG P-21439]
MRLVFLLFLSLVMVGAIVGCSGTAKVSTPPATGETTPPSSVAEAWWSPDMDCSVCHSKNVESMGNSTLTISQHAQAGQKCVDCHGLETLQEAHKGGSKVPGVINVRMPKEMCFECHGSYEEIATRTADSTVLEKKEGGYVNPHVRPNENHEDNVECYECHKMHMDYNNKANCLSCHHTGELTCYTCH